MNRTLAVVTIFVVLSGWALSQERAKGTLFDEFGNVSKKELVAHVEKLRAYLMKHKYPPEYMDTFILMWAIKPDELKKRKDVITSALYKDCLDCMGDARITYVEGKLGKQIKTQIWLVPPGGEVPNTDQ